MIPVMLALISGFLAVMLQVETQQQMDAATKLAAESFFQSPRLAADAPGTSCCAVAGLAPLDTSGMPRGCRYAAETFYGTLTERSYLVFPAGGSHPLCRRNGAPVGAVTNAAITCDIDAIDPALNPPTGLPVVRCRASATLDFSRTPLAWAVVWSATVQSSAEALPPPFRR